MSDEVASCVRCDELAGAIRRAICRAIDSRSEASSTTLDAVEAILRAELSNAPTRRLPLEPLFTESEVIQAADEWAKINIAWECGGVEGPDLAEVLSRIRKARGGR